MIVAVNGLFAGSDPAPGVGVLRCLRDPDGGGHRLVGLASDPLEPALYEAGLLDRARVVPPPAADHRAFLEGLSRLVGGGPAVFIPSGEADLPALLPLQPALRDRGIETLLPGKRTLERLAQGNPLAGLPLPVLTPARPGRHRRPAGPREIPPPASLVKSPVRAPLPPEDPHRARYALALLADRESRVVGHAAVRKLLSSRGGGTWMALTVDGDPFAPLAEGLARRLRWTGPLTVELQIGGDGEVHPAGLQPRFPDWIHGAALAGVNLPGQLVRIASGRPAAPPGRILPGQLFVQISLDIVTDVNRFGLLSLTGETTHDPA